MTGDRPAGFRAFTIIWLGQILSTLGTRMTNFALSIYIWKKTGHVSDLALLTFCAFIATVIFSPIAGSLIDRWDRRLTIVISDVGSAVATAAIMVLFFTHSVAIWQLFAVNLVTGAVLAFQAPAYQTLISVMMEKGQYPRANAMISLSQSIPAIFAPTAAAALLVVTSVQVILAIDVASYLIAIGTVFLVAIPGRATREATESGQGMWRDMVFGFRYMIQRPGLLGLQTVIFATFLIGVMGWLLLTPFVMARTGNDQAQVGIVQSVGAIGGVAGGLVMTLLPDARRKVARMLIAIGVFYVFGRIMLGLGHSLVVWAVGWCCAWASMPFFLAYNQAIWQAKVAPAVQGRVFAAQNMLENLATPLALAIAGPLADYVFDPAMRPGGALAGLFGPVVGTGPGAGMAVMFVITGLIGAAVALIGFILPSIREVETRIPDYDAVVPAVASLGDDPPEPPADLTADDQDQAEENQCEPSQKIPNIE